MTRRAFSRGRADYRHPRENEEIAGGEAAPIIPVRVPKWADDGAGDLLPYNDDRPRRWQMKGELEWTPDKEPAFEIRRSGRWLWLFPYWIDGAWFATDDENEGLTCLPADFGELVPLDMRQYVPGWAEWAVAWTEQK